MLRLHSSGITKGSVEEKTLAHVSSPVPKKESHSIRVLLPQSLLLAQSRELLNTMVFDGSGNCSLEDNLKKQTQNLLIKLISLPQWI